MVSFIKPQTSDQHALKSNFMSSNGWWYYFQEKQNDQIVVVYVIQTNNKNISISVSTAFFSPITLRPNTTLMLSEGPIGHLHKNAVLQK